MDVWHLDQPYNYVKRIVYETETIISPDKSPECLTPGLGPMS